MILTVIRIININIIKLRNIANTDNQFNLSKDFTMNSIIKYDNSHSNSSIRPSFHKTIFEYFIYSPPITPEINGCAEHNPLH